MKKLNYLLLFIVLFAGNSFLLVSQENNSTTFNNAKNHFRLGFNYCLNGTGDEVSLMYQNEYQRKLNKYLEIGAGVGFSNYISEYPVNYDNHNYSPDKAYNLTSIVSMDIMIDLLVMDFKRHFFKIGIGYSLRKVKRIHWSSILYTNYTDKSGNELAFVTYNKTDGFDSSVIIGVEYGYRISPHLSISANARYYGEGKYVSLVLAGFSFYYSF